MRTRTFSALAVVAASVLLLAGCTGSPEPDTTVTATPAVDLCSVAAPSGETVESISVSGEVGESPTVEFATPLEIVSAERSVAVEGDGTAIADGDYVTYALGIYDASTGELLQEGGYGDEPLPPTQISLGTGPDTYFGCATEGSRLVMTVPDSGSGALVYVIDVLEVIPADAWCAVTEPGDAFPTVEFDADGNPTIAIPDADPPADVEVEVLTAGDGDVVQSGDNVTVDYEGVAWSDGEVFDSSFDRGEPATFSTLGVVTGFQRALEGQTVGSTVVVSMPPVCAYGEAGTSSSDLAGETLVFVVDIIDTARATG